MLLCCYVNSKGYTMNKNMTVMIAIAVLALLGIGGGVVVSQNNKDKEAKNSAIATQESEAMAMKAKEEAAMKKTEEIMVKDDSVMQKTDSSTGTSDDTAMMKKSSGYITLAEYNENKDAYSSSKKVLFFAASWCPTCQALTSDIEKNITSIPADTVIIRADYDKETDLKKTYGVTIQHTLVQIDNDGNPLTKWSGGNTLDTVIAKTI
jgi:thiol-disulfide isomerase/thioredoxin